MAKTNYIIPIFVPHKGCPHDCVFCNQKKITGNIIEVTGIDVEMRIEEYIDSIEDIENKHVEVAFFGGSFTGIEKEKQKELLSVAFAWKKRGIIQDIRISTRPDYIDESIMTFLKEYGVSIIELGVQSMDEEVLLQSTRGHVKQDVMNAVKTMKKFDVKIGLQMMIGLPSDTPEKSYYTAQQIISLKPDFVRIYPTLVVKDTYLEKMYVKGDYEPLNVEGTVEILKKILLAFLKNNITVIRIGLQPTENITMGNEVIAGPFHPSIRQLVETEIICDMLDFLFDQYNIRNLENITLQANDKDMSSLAGHKRKNVDFIKKKYKIQKIKMTRNNDLLDRQILIQTGLDEILYSISQYIQDAI
ncbi:radical SAM protein [Lutibacter sp. B2]|nr:radical SAM protein [Lutibacter sp. B2]